MTPKKVPLKKHYRKINWWTKKLKSNITGYWQLIHIATSSSLTEDKKTQKTLSLSYIATAPKRNFCFFFVTTSQNHQHLTFYQRLSTKRRWRISTQNWSINSQFKYNLPKKKKHNRKKKHPTSNFHNSFDTVDNLLQ